MSCQCGSLFSVMVILFHLRSMLFSLLGTGFNISTLLYLLLSDLWIVQSVSPYVGVSYLV